MVRSFFKKKEPIVEEQEVFQVEVEEENVSTVKEERGDTKTNVKQEKNQNIILR